MIEVTVTDRLSEAHEDGTRWSTDDEGQLHVLAGSDPIAVYARGAWVSARSVPTNPVEIGRRMLRALASLEKAE